jgi:hypothetical protein
VAGDHDGAIADAERAIAITPRLGAAWVVRGRARHAKGDIPAARADWDRAISIDPNNAEAFHNRAVVKAIRSDLAGAIRDYTRAIDSRPDIPQPYINRGRARRQAGNLSGAVADFSRVLGLESKSASAYHNRGSTQLMMDDFAEAGRTGSGQCMMQQLPSPDVSEEYSDFRPSVSAQSSCRTPPLPVEAWPHSQSSKVSKAVSEQCQTHRGRNRATLSSWHRTSVSTSWHSTHSSRWLQMPDALA